MCIEQPPEAKQKIFVTKLQWSLWRWEKIKDCKIALILNKNGNRTKKSYKIISERWVLLFIDVTIVVLLSAWLYVTRQLFSCCCRLSAPFQLFQWSLKTATIKKFCDKSKFHELRKKKRRGRKVFPSFFLNAWKSLWVLKIGLRKDRMMEPRKEENCLSVSFKIAQFLFVCRQSPWKFPMNITTKVFPGR